MAAFVAVGLVLASGCSEATGGSAKTGTTDAGSGSDTGGSSDADAADAATDASADAPFDATPVADADVGADGATDVTASDPAGDAVDAVADAPTDTLADTVADTVADSLGDAGADAGPDTAADAVTGDGSCFVGGVPNPDALVGDVQPGPACTSVADPSWFPAGAPAPTLQVQIGWRDKTGAWHAYADGDWIPLYIGIQGGFMVFPAPQVLLPGKTDPQIKMQYQGFVLSACAPVASAMGSVVNLVHASSAEPWYLPEPAAPVFAQFNTMAQDIGLSCGIWVELHWRYRLPDSNTWGQAKVKLRTYIASLNPMMPGG